MINERDAKASPLGKKSSYISQYDPSLLFPIPRKIKRNEINIPDPIPFTGIDLWNAYELSWLNNKGKPQVAIAEFIIDCSSKNIIESKSLKLYLNSFNNTKIDSTNELKDILSKDLGQAVEGRLEIKIGALNSFAGKKLQTPAGFCIDDIDVYFDKYEVDPKYLSSEEKIVSETLYSNLLKSNCLVTGQPDWGSIEISYTGQQINKENLLRYLVSFRDHNEFHEQCVERIFMDLTTHCHLIDLTVKAFYTRRGGLDINPMRSTKPFSFENIRTIRQ